ncbi:MAG: hypothetical protein K9H49_03865 [Bacteroidales bacterium]|nr:hypothetical protein [Bacteroidales bacterium]MCF8389427.1 hypothetical protein [Bacteroidales bacterium]
MIIDNDSKFCSNCGLGINKSEEIKTDSVTFPISPNIIPITKRFIERYYTFSILELVQYSDILDWDIISKYGNSNLWSADILTRFKDKINWNLLSTSKTFPFTKVFLKLYENFWDWSELSRNNSIEFSEDLINSFENNWVWSRLYFNEAISSHVRILHKAEASHTKIGWHLGEIPWLEIDYRSLMNIRLSDFNINIFRNYSEKWNWTLLSENLNIPWTIELIRKYKDKWDWEKICTNSEILFDIKLLNEFREIIYWELLFWNEKMVWTPEIIIEFENMIDFDKLCSAKNVDWNEDLLELFENKISFRSLSYLYNGLITVDILNKYPWDLRGLSCNQNLNWSIGLIKELQQSNVEFKNFYFDELLTNKAFISKVDLKEYISIDPYYSKLLSETAVWSTDFFMKIFPSIETIGLICNRTDISWSIEILETHQKWDWKRLSRNTSLPWNEKLIGRFEDKWDWLQLSHNPSIHWTLDLLTRYEEVLEWGSLDMYKKYPGLSSSNNLDWNLDILERYSSRWEVYYLIENETVWDLVFKKNLNKNVVEDTLSKYSIWKESNKSELF